MKRLLGLILDAMRTPPGVVVILCVLVGDVVAWWKSGERETAMMHVIWKGFTARTTRCWMPADSYFFVNADGTLALFDLEDSADALAKKVQTDLSNVAVVSELWTRDRAGLVAPCMDVHRQARHIYRFATSQGKPIEASAALGPEFIDAAREAGEVALASRLARPVPPPRRTFHPLGMLHDIGFVLLVGVFVSGVPRAIATLRGASARKLLARAACPRCRYDLTGVPAHGGGRTCPECGSVWHEVGLPSGTNSDGNVIEPTRSS